MPWPPIPGLSCSGRSRCAIAFASLALMVGGAVPLAAQTGEQAVAKPVQVDWPAAVRGVQALSERLSTDADDKSLSAQHRSAAAQLIRGFTSKEGMAPLAHLNELVGGLFPGIGTVPVPVLVPFDTAGLLGRTARAGSPDKDTGRAKRGAFLHGIGADLHFIPGTTGYDALLTFAPEFLKQHGITARPLIHVGGSALVYVDEEPGEIVPELQDLHPGLRRTRNDESVNYSFRKFGVPYFATIFCTKRTDEPQVVQCSDAESLARPVLENMRLLGGAPRHVKAPEVSIPRPRPMSKVFKYHAPGKLLRGTGVDGRDGLPERIVWGDIRFPVMKTPSFAQSQDFMHWGNCVSHDGTTDNIVPLPRQPHDTHDRYRCKQNDKELLHWEGHPENYSYPWRDTFCEARGRETLACPAGRGHQGLDIRPRSCKPATSDAERCEPDIHEVVAVAGGYALRDRNKIRLIVVRTRIYYVYLHMNTNTIEAAHIEDQKFNRVWSGRVLGRVGDYMGERGGTTAHLHFEVRPGTPAAPRSPYLTLVRANERLIGARGSEIGE